jgi:proteasome alpha subunit
VTLPFYASPEQLMRERSEIARKGIARGRSVVVLTFVDGVLMVAENHSTTLHKISEIYDRIGFAAVGRYNEFENLRVAGIRHADLRGYSNDRRDVTGRSLANAYAQTLGAIFTEQLKPYEVELCVAEVGSTAADDLLYRVTYDGSIFDEEGFVVMGGTTEPIAAAMREAYRPGMPLDEAIAAAVGALRSTPGPGNASSSSSDGASGRELGSKQLEVAVLDRRRPRRAFRRLTGAALTAVLPGAKPEPADTKPEDAETKPADAKPGDAKPEDAKPTEPDTTAAEARPDATKQAEKPGRPSKGKPANPPTGDAEGDPTTT